jgi:Ca2+-binding RTX toxin-like protein
LTGSELLFSDGSLVKLASSATTMYGSNIAATGDFLVGSSANDVIRGLAGADTIYGGAGADTIYGGAGADNIIGGAGNDLMYGGNSSADDGAIDTFKYTYNTNEGNDLIVGFNNAQDIINISGVAGTDAAAKYAAAVVSVTAVGGNTVVALTSGTTITLVGVTSGIDVNDFTFV